MKAGQQLICKAVGSLETYQSEIGNCSAEIFGCSIEVLIPWGIMTSSEMIFRFQEIIGVLNFLVKLNSKGSYFPGKLDSRVLISRVLF